MIFGIPKSRRVLLLCAGMVVFSTIIIGATQAYLSIHRSAYRASKSTMTTLEKNWREQQIEQHLKQQYGEQFLSLPRADSEKTLRSTILSLLGKSMHAANFESLDYQFLDPQTIAVETLDHQTTVQMQAEVVLLRGKLRHMEDFYTFLDFLQEHASYYELRGCDILRVDEGPGKPDSTPLELPGLQMSCMINWFLLRQGTL